MAKVKIQGHASGTGVLTVTAPNTSTDRTITLPDTTGTLLDENSSVPAANLTGTVADARISALTASKLTGALPAISGASLTGITTGKVLQVASAALGTGGMETSTSTDADMITVTLTPTSSSNKFLILASNPQCYSATTSPYGRVMVYSDLTSAFIGTCSTYQNNANPGYVGGGTISVEHSLSTWSSGSVTIRLKGSSGNNGYIHLGAYGQATLTVMEISA